MGLPWVRLDTNIYGHDKVADLLADDTATVVERFRALAAYVFSIGYAGGHDTDGLVKFSVLEKLYGNKNTGPLLVKHNMWLPDPLGWRVVNYGKRQQLTATTKQIKNAQRAGALKANCVRWHGAECKCWEEAS